MQKVLEKIKKWVVDNAPVLVYFVFAVLIEMTAVLVVEGTPFLTRPFMSVGLLLVICGIVLTIPGNKPRVIVCTTMLLLQTVLDIIFAVIFDMTDQYFDFGMLNLRNDAFAILESIPVDFITFYVGLFLSLAFLVLGLRLSRVKKRVRSPRFSIFFYVALSLAGVGTMGGAFFSYYPREAKDKYDGMVAGKELSAYSSYGMIGNLLGEVGKVLFQDTATLAEEDINQFIYADDSEAERTPYYGIAKGKNVVTILAESLEWYAFLRDGVNGGVTSLEGEYPNALPISEADLKTLYPNLWEFYGESVLATNFHGREKTDIAETLSIVGSYPTGAYINYEYAENTIPYTLPNMLKTETDGDIAVRSFHNGFKSFYNREEAHPMLGFEANCPIDMYDMETVSDKLVEEGGEEIFHNYMDEGERNLDSEMIATFKDKMFPTDQRFYTYITTITMHGMYYDRKNLQKENNTKLAAQIALLESYKPTEEEYDKNLFGYAERLYYYMTTGLEFDYMLGEMKKDLQAKGLLEDTLIVIFGDHNAYYQEMSNYVKGIQTTAKAETEKKFTDLYNVPLMIWDRDLAKALKDKGQSRVVDKFTCTADIVPTLLDLLGIKYYSNLYYGHSIFAEEQSVLYSRAYDIFLGEGILRRSVKGEFYLYDGITERGERVADTIAAFEAEGVKLVDKIEHCDYIFKQDHFGSAANYSTYQKNIKRLNGWA